MTDSNSIVNLGDLTKPATVLIEKISDAVGGYFKPGQIVRIAKAEAEAEKIKAVGKLEIVELEQRAVQRFVFEEARNQVNIESITAQALPYLKEDSEPIKMEEDWIVNFFDKCRLISDEHMQFLWAKLLAEEANSPGSVSKRTINLLGSLDKEDAVLFTNLCGFAWWAIEEQFMPLIYNCQHPLYNSHGINFESLLHLDYLGLITFHSNTGFVMEEISKPFQIFYHGISIDVVFPDARNTLSIGYTMFTRAGMEIAHICESKSIPDYFDYVLTNFTEQGLIISSPYPCST
jgi:Protein of unknown function (DUF2806)